MKQHDIYADIRNNKLKSYVLLVLFSFIVIVLGYVIGLYFLGDPYTGLIAAFFIGVIYSLFAYYSGDSTILSSARAKKIRKADDPFLYNTVEGLAIAAGIPMPEIYVIKEESPNAFATGRDPQHAKVAVTTGLRAKLKRQELEGVIAHELSHIKNYDIRFAMLIVVLIGVVVFLSDIMLRSFLFGGGRKQEGGAWLILVALALAILAPIFAQLIRFAISRKREYLADADGAYLTGYPKGLADALKKIRDDHDTVVDTANRATAHMYIENPLRRTKKRSVSWFATHPDINDRIRRLEAM